MEDGFPRYSYDLLRQLNEEIPKPAWPQTAAGAANLDPVEIRMGIWFAAQRALVDALIDQLVEQEREKNHEFDDQELRSGDAFGRVLPADLNIREASVGRDEPVDESALVGVHHLDSL